MFIAIGVGKRNGYFSSYFSLYCEEYKTWPFWYGTPAGCR